MICFRPKYTRQWTLRRLTPICTRRLGHSREAPSRVVRCVNHAATRCMNVLSFATPSRSLAIAITLGMICTAAAPLQSVLAHGAG